MTILRDAVCDRPLIGELAIYNPFAISSADMSRERLGQEIYDPNEESSSFQSSVRNKTTTTAIGKVREHFVSTKC